MAEGKRGTAEHRQIAARIDARMKQLDALKLQEVEILSGMAAHMEDFYLSCQEDSTQAAPVDGWR